VTGSSINRLNVY